MSSLYYTTLKFELRFTGQRCNSDKLSFGPQYVDDSVKVASSESWPGRESLLSAPLKTSVLDSFFRLESPTP